jgi:hypothetical protein
MGSEGQQIGDGHPAHSVEIRAEFPFKGGQCQLNYAGVELANEASNAGDANHEPWIPGSAADELKWCGFIAAHAASSDSLSIFAQAPR